MFIEHIPLLKIERELHDIPRGMERFSAYLKTIMNDNGDDVSLVPMISMNPMGREHVTERLDELLALDADMIASETVAEAVTRFGGLEGEFKHGLVVMDDVRGGWTNRTTSDFAFRFSWSFPVKRPWITTPLWVSESVSRQSVRQLVLMSIFRVAYSQQNSTPKTLSQMMAQEGAAGVFAGLHPQYDDEELDYSRYVITPYLETTDYSAQIAALYGDEAARSLGYQPLGLSKDVGFAIALAAAMG
jgi:hypothetical protein